MTQQKIISEAMEHLQLEAYHHKEAYRLLERAKQMGGGATTTTAPRKGTRTIEMKAKLRHNMNKAMLRK